MQTMSRNPWVIRCGYCGRRRTVLNANQSCPLRHFGTHHDWRKEKR